MNIYLQNKEEDFQNTLNFFKKDISSLRTGRVNMSVLDNIKVEAYETLNPINALGNINISEGKDITIVPWDKGVIKNIEKAIIESDLGLGVVNEGDKIRLSAPKMTEENRKEVVKKLNERLERARVSLRQNRDNVKDEITKAEDEKEISEDEKFRFIKELDDFVAKKNEELKSLRDDKEKDIMEI
jgi:ribosome recycling factor